MTVIQLILELRERPADAEVLIKDRDKPDWLNSVNGVAYSDLMNQVILS